MPELDVTPQGAQPSGAGDKNPQDGKGNEKVTLTRAEFESMRRELNETRDSERFWANRARGPQEQRVDEPEETIETDDLIPDVTGDGSVDEAIFSNPDKWAEAVSKGPAAIEAFVRKAGFVTGKEAADIATKVARRTVDVERRKMSADATIIRDFPDLNDPKSELFKATAAEVRQLVALDPSARNRPSTLYAAAKTAKATLAAAKAGEPRRGDPDGEDDRYERFREEDDEPEADRRHRANSQDATRHRGRDTNEDESFLGPQAREIMQAFGVTEDEYKASARELGAGRHRGRR